MHIHMHTLKDIEVNTHIGKCTQVYIQRKANTHTITLREGSHKYTQIDKIRFTNVDINKDIQRNV